MSFRSISLPSAALAAAAVVVCMRHYRQLCYPGSNRTGVDLEEIISKAAMGIIVAFEVKGIIAGTTSDPI